MIWFELVNIQEAAN